MICAAKINVRNSKKGSCAASHDWGQAQAHSGFPSPLEKKQLILLSHSEANQDFSRKISKISTFIKHAGGSSLQSAFFPLRFHHKMCKQPEENKCSEPYNGQFKDRLLSSAKHSLKPV